MLVYSRIDILKLFNYSELQATDMTTKFLCILSLPL